MNADGLGAWIIYVSKRRKAWVDSLPRLLTQSSRGVFGQLADIFVRHAKLDGHHQNIVIRIVRAVVRLNVFDDTLLQKPLHLTAVHGIAREPINLPTNNAARFVLLNPRHHIAEHGATGLLRAFLFDKLLRDFQSIALGKRAQLYKLRINGEHLFVFNIR